MSSPYDMDKKTEILNAALSVAESDGYREMTRSNIAARARVSPGLLNFYFGTLDRLRDAVMSAAIEREIYPVIAQGLLVGHPSARDAPERIKKLARATLV